RILKKYLDRLEPKAVEGKEFGEFLQGFQNIFTINYDQITYYGMIHNFMKKGCATHADVILPLPTKLHIEKIKGTIDKKGRGIYYLHGAFHIIHLKRKENGKYDKFYKLKTRNKCEEINKKHEEI